MPAPPIFGTHFGGFFTGSKNGRKRHERLRYALKISYPKRKPDRLPTIILEGGAVKLRGCIDVNLEMEFERSRFTCDCWWHSKDGNFVNFVRRSPCCVDSKQWGNILQTQAESLLLGFEHGKKTSYKKAPKISKIPKMTVGSIQAIFTLPETNIAPENWPLEKEIPIGNHHF